MRTMSSWLQLQLQLHVKEIYNQIISHKNLVILAFTGAELAGGGGDSAPSPSRRVILNPILGRGSKYSIWADPTQNKDL